MSHCLPTKLNKVLFVCLLFKPHILGNNGHHHPCLPSSVLFMLGPQAVSLSCLPESFSRPPQVMIDDKLLRGGKRVPPVATQSRSDKGAIIWQPILCAIVEEGWGVEVNKRVEECLQRLMRKKVTSLLLRSAVICCEACALTPPCQWILINPGGHLD